MAKNKIKEWAKSEDKGFAKKGKGEKKDTPLPADIQKLVDEQFDLNWHKVDSEGKLLGGKADKMKPEDFDEEQLKIGTEHELEHTDDEDTAREIAMDHLAEDPDYYKKLKKIEK
jgi:hypothetical protein